MPQVRGRTARGNIQHSDNEAVEEKRGEIMSSIEERIQKHELFVRVLNEKIARHNAMLVKWDAKVKFHNNAIYNLKAKQEKKVN